MLQRVALTLRKQEVSKYQPRCELSFSVSVSCAVQRGSVQHEVRTIGSFSAQRGAVNSQFIESLVVTSQERGAR